ncbi:MAG: glutamate synthase subunit beta [Parvularculales bacterium]
MGKVTGFMEIGRQDRHYAPASDRVRHYREFVLPLGDEQTRQQAARCMDCGIPYCHTGCPVENQIPDWNDLVWQDDWQEACQVLHSTNNFPEFTGRICPAPCEEACTLNIEDQPVTIKTIECAIVDKGWSEGWIVPKPAASITGKKVAIVGSGPAGLACAQQLARTGHDVHVYEKNARPGGLLRYGIPDFKMEKDLIDRRLQQMEDEGVTFHCQTHVGLTVSSEQLVKSHDAIVLTGGAETPRDLPIEGREFEGIHFAMDFLTQQNRRISGEIPNNVFDEVSHGITPILAGGRHVVVIGGGDTGSDCIGTSFRQGALSVTQLEIMPQPPAHEDKALTWPDWPLKMRTSSSQAEGAQRDFSVMTKRFESEGGRVTTLECVRLDGSMTPIEGTEFVLRADLVLLAMGFVHPIYDGLLEELGVEITEQGVVAANDRDYKTNLDKIFTAGDMRRGQSLVVWAIREGRQAARAVDGYLMGESILPR